MKENHLQDFYNDAQEELHNVYLQWPNDEKHKMAIDMMNRRFKKLKEKYNLKPDPIEQAWLDRNLN